MLANIDLDSSAEVMQFCSIKDLYIEAQMYFSYATYFDNFRQVSSSPSHRSVSLPRQLRDSLLVEMETIVHGALADENIEARPLSDLIFTCALLSNFINSSYFGRSVLYISLYNFSSSHRFCI